MLPSLKEAIAECQQCVEREERPRIEAVAVVLRAIKNLPDLLRLCDKELRTPRHPDRNARPFRDFVVHTREYLDTVPPLLFKTLPLPEEDI